jgi:hypothetical protein
MESIMPHIPSLTQLMESQTQTMGAIVEIVKNQMLISQHVKNLEARVTMLEGLLLTNKEVQ